MGLRTWLGVKRKPTGLTIEQPAAPGRAEFSEDCSMGAYSYINGAGLFSATRIGRFCSIGPNVMAGAAEHLPERLSTHPFTIDERPLFHDDAYLTMLDTRSAPRFRETLVGNDVWIGGASILRRGVEIGDGAIVGAGSVVTRSVQPYAIVVGSPARVIRYRFAEHVVSRLLALKWWDYVPDRRIVGTWDAPIEDVLDKLEEAKARDGLQRLSPRTVRL